MFLSINYIKLYIRLTLKALYLPHMVYSSCKCNPTHFVLYNIISFIHYGLIPLAWFHFVILYVLGVPLGVLYSLR